MDCRITSNRRRSGAFTLIEGMVAFAIGLVAITAVLSTWAYALRSFAAVGNYLELDQEDQLALDQISREIRQATNVAALVSGTNITFTSATGQSIQYIYDSNARTLVRVSNGQRTTNLTGCDSFQIALYQRTPSSNTLDCFSTTSTTNAKLVQLSWKCSRTILGAKVDTESVQSAKIALRRK